MYQPYIRGKQFELIGIRELTAPVLSVNRDKVSPIIEPVKDSSTFRSTLQELVKYNINFTVIVNPQHGTFQNSESILSAVRASVNGYTNFQVGIILNQATDNTSIISILQQFPAVVHKISLIHQFMYDNVLDILAQYQAVAPISFNVVDFGKTSRRYYRSFPPDTLVEMEDNFASQTRNADYLVVDNSFFSEEHLHYDNEGFVGFSDFLTIGDDYSESGFLPYAVAIHLSYPDAQNKIFVKHFVSDSNSDQSDVPGKFAEALDKLIDWCNTNTYNSIAIPIFRDFHTTGHFPGLGTLKKLSLMNHIDLVLRLI